jgi:hypothetical protein
MSRPVCAAVPALLAACLLAAGAARAESQAAEATGARPSSDALTAVAPSETRPAAPEAERVDSGPRAPEAAEPGAVDSDAEEETEDVDAADVSDGFEPAGGPPDAAGATSSGEATSTAPLTSPPAMIRGPKKQVYGWIEDVLIDPRHALKLPAKLDTGADTTSLDARNIRRARRDGEDYVRFVVTEPATGESVELEKPFVRAVRIKGHGNEPARRVVVRMRICIGDRSRSIEVNLVDRAHFEYPLLLGRNALRDVAVIDPNLRRTREPSCWDAADSWAAAPPSDTTGSAGGATPTCENAPMC